MSHASAPPRVPAAPVAENSFSSNWKTFSAGRYTRKSVAANPSQQPKTTSLYDLIRSLSLISLISPDFTRNLPTDCAKLSTPMAIIHRGREVSLIN